MPLQQYENGFVGIVPAYRDTLNVEHDMRIGPCACGAFHTQDDPPRDLPVPAKCRIDELLFRVGCGLIAEDVKWSQVSDHLIYVAGVSPGLASMIRELDRRTRLFLDERKVEVDGDDELFYSGQRPGIESPLASVKFEHGHGLWIVQIRAAGRVGVRPSLNDVSFGYSVMR